MRMSTSLGEDLQDYADSVEDVHLFVGLAVSLGDDRGAFLSFVLGLRIEVIFLRVGVSHGDVVEPGLDELLEVLDLRGFEFCVDKQTVEILPAQVLCDLREFALGEEGFLGYSAHLGQGGVC